ncbi:cyclase family protein [Cysteiniphilum sp. 19X3-34]|nr:cyclase family protein [Cysteiniphilum sp. 19X3-34]
MTSSIYEKFMQGKVEVFDLTAPLSTNTPVIRLPPDRGQPWPFKLEKISRYDEKGNEVYWNNIQMSEHTGTHFDAPVHWFSGKDSIDVSSVPCKHLIAPAVVVDMSEQVTDPNFLLERKHVEQWCEIHGTLPEGAWLLFRSGWDSHDLDADSFLNHGYTPGVSESCAKWLAEQTPIIGIGVETVGTDAGQAGKFEQPYPVHWYFHKAAKYGLTQLKNLAKLPATGVVIIVAPLPIVGGSGSPCRVLALIE